MHRRFVATAAVISLTIASCARAGRTTPEAIEWWGFSGPWDAASDASIRSHGHLLDVIVTGWITLDSATGRMVSSSSFPDTVRPRAGTPRHFALVTSWHGAGFHARPIRRLASDAAALASTAGAIAARAAADGHAGLVLDFETLDVSDSSALLRVARAIADSARGRGISEIVVAVPAADRAYPVSALLAIADRVLVMLYDQHWSTSQPGPIAAPAWVRDALAARIAEAGDPRRVVAALPLYGYWWRRGRTAESVSYAEGVTIAARAGAPLERDSIHSTLRARAGGNAWEMWLSDAVLLRRLVQEAERQGVRRIALWRLGQEDPAIWENAPKASGRIGTRRPSG